MLVVPEAVELSSSFSSSCGRLSATKTCKSSREKGPPWEFGSFTGIVAVATAAASASTATTEGACIDGTVAAAAAIVADAAVGSSITELGPVCGRCPLEAGGDDVRPLGRERLE